MEYSKALEFARELRRNQTKSEKVFWSQVRNRQFYGFKFTRQYIIKYSLVDNVNRFFIADFYCHERKLIVEIDGKIHDYQLDADTDREEILKAQAYRVIRFKNKEVENDWSNVSQRLLEMLR